MMEFVDRNGKTITLREAREWKPKPTAKEVQEAINKVVRAMPKDTLPISSSTMRAVMENTLRTYLKPLTK